MIEAPKHPSTTLSLPETEPTENNKIVRDFEISKERRKHLETYHEKQQQNSNGIQGRVTRCGYCHTYSAIFGIKWRYFWLFLTYFIFDFLEKLLGNFENVKCSSGHSDSRAFV